MLLYLDFGSEVPIYQQIRNQIVLGIAQGKLANGERLPTIRALSEECGVNMMTVNKAYQLLKQEGYLQADRRSGCVVCHPEQTQKPKEETVAALRLCLSELRLAGISEDQAMQLCSALYREGKG